MSYNGWRNYETWLCNIWYDQYFEEIARESEPGISCGDLAGRFEDVVNNDIHEELGYNIEGLAGDILNSAIRDINFEELADAFMEFVPAEEEEEDEDDEDCTDD